jgi:hypothetical protein
LLLTSTVPYSFFSSESLNEPYHPHVTTLIIPLDSTVTPLNKTLLSLTEKAKAKRANPLYPDSKPASSELYTQDSRGLLPQEESQARMLLEKWIKAHTGRVVLAAAGWTVALGGLLLAY